MERLQLSARPRATATKGQRKQLRNSGHVPAIIYGRHTEPLSATFDSKDIYAILHSPAGINTIVDLQIAGEQTTVMMKSATRDILHADRITHADFMRISLLEKLEIHVPVLLTGESEGIRAGGILHQSIREITLKCLPTNIPEHLELDISALAVGESLTVADLSVPEDTELLADPADVVVAVTAPRTEETAEEEDQSLEEGSTAAEE